MDAKIFEQSFFPLTDPVILRANEHWQQNPAAQSLGLSDPELELLSALPSEGAMLSLHGQYYHASVSPMEEGKCYILRQSELFLSAMSSSAAQLRTHITPMFSLVDRLYDRLQDNAEDTQTAPSPGADLESARRLLSQLNRHLYQIYYVSDQMTMVSTSDSCFLFPSDVDPVTLLTDLENRITARCAELDLTLQFDLPAEGTILLHADAAKLIDLFLILLSNSIKALDGNPCRVKLSLTRNERGQAIFSYSDNGPGLPPDVLSVPLWNQPNDLTPFRGAGFGLSLAQRIVSAHGGTLVIQGSQILISLPTCPPRSTLRSPNRPQVFQGEGYCPVLCQLSPVLPASAYAPPIPPAPPICF